MADKSRTCFFVGQRGAHDSPGALSEVIFETLIAPTIERFPDFTVERWDFEHEPGSISERLMDRMMMTDLVIADLSELSGSGYFELGLRHANGLPMVLIADQEYVIAVEARDFSLVRYSLNAGGPDQETVAALEAAIHEALEQPSRRNEASNRTALEEREDLAHRIEEVADAIALLRINSLGDAVAELGAISDTLKAASDQQTPSALQIAGVKVLAILFRHFDQLASVKGARIVISGAVGLVVGGVGISGVVAMGLALAAFHGKDVFKAAIDKLPWGSGMRKDL